MYITVVTENTEAFENLNALCDKVLAKCKEYPVAMVKISADSLEDLSANETVKAVYPPFPTAYSFDVGVNAEFCEEFSPSMKEIRKCLRFCARLNSAPESVSEGKRFFFMFDSDFDGRITVTDIREALKINAKLSPKRTYSKNICGAYGSFWVESQR